MHDALWVLVGVFIGSTLGLVLGGILCSGKVTDLETELWELRHQRKLLKEEIVRLTAKPKPRTSPAPPCNAPLATSRTILSLGSNV